MREVTLIHDFCRLLEGRPTSRPMTLVAAMINVAVRGLYASTVQDGLRLDAWREPQLAAIQEQLGQVNLLPYVAAAFECERVSSSHFMETLTTENYDRILGGGGGATKQWWGKFKDREYVYLALAPRGWVYQNMVVVARHGQAMAEAFDLKSGLVFPAKVDAEMTEIGRKLGRYGPYTFLAGIAVPNAMRALQTCARNQTLVNQAMVACALERHRLANGCYPKALAELMPQYLARIPADVIGGEPLKYRREDKGGFVLYSVWWNEKDDGGVTCAKSPADTSNLAKGDWVWPYRENMFR